MAKFHDKICLQSWVPLRSNPTSVSEMVSSMLFGERCKVLQCDNDWIQVQTLFDSYVGWIPENYLCEALPEHEKWIRVLGSHSAVLQRDTYRIHISAGSNLPQSDTLSIDNQTWKITIRDAFVPDEPWQIGLGFMYVPYLWGGRSDCGLDCSGLSQIVYKIKDIALPRDAKDQVHSGTDVLFADRLPNDLAFFHNESGKITHVGIVTPHGILHANGRVRQDILEESGIRNSETGVITHSLNCIKRIV